MWRQCSNLEKQHINEYIIIMDIIHCGLSVAYTTSYKMAILVTWRGLLAVIFDLTLGKTAMLASPLCQLECHSHTRQQRGRPRFNFSHRCHAARQQCRAASLHHWVSLTYSVGLSSSLTEFHLQCWPLFVTEFHLQCWLVFVIEFHWQCRPLFESLTEFHIQCWPLFEVEFHL